MFDLDETVSPEDRLLLFRPVMLNFLYQSRGLLAVLPARDSPRWFREAMLPWVSRRLFDSRVRVIDYVGEDEEAAYVVSLRPLKDTAAAMKKMERASEAAGGARKKPFLEFNAFEIVETMVGPEQAAKMFLFGIKRVREVGNLGLGILRPELRAASAVRSMVDYEFQLNRTSVGLHVTGVRPAFASHVLVPHRHLGAPYAELIPPP